MMKKFVSMKMCLFKSKLKLKEMVSFITTNNKSQELLICPTNNFWWDEW